MRQKAFTPRKSIKRYYSKRKIEKGKGNGTRNKRGITPYTHHGDFFFFFFKLGFCPVFVSVLV